MSREAATLAGRAAAEAGMVDTCTIRRGTGGSVTDPNTGKVTDATTVVYSGPCKVKGGIYAARKADAGEAQWLLTQPQLHLPMSATGIRAGDLATLDSSELDPDLVGVVLHIDGPAHGSFSTARRFACTEGGPDE